MPSITREQFNKWNSKATNGFSFDIKEYVGWGNKALIREEKLPGGKICEFKISYWDEYTTKTNDWGCSWNVATGKKIPCLSVNILHPGSVEGIYRVQHYISNEPIGEVQDKNNYNVLCKLASTVDVEKYLTDIREGKRCA